MKRRTFAGIVLVACAAIFGIAMAAALVTIHPRATPSGDPSDVTTPQAAITAPSGALWEPTFDHGAYSTDDPASIWVVTNKTRPLDPIDFVPSDLAAVTFMAVGGDQQLRAEAVDALRVLNDDARALGWRLKVSTAYRSYGHQAGIYQGWVRENGRAWADVSSARPGFSEHQTGWAIDLYDTDECRLEFCFGASDPGVWLAEHSWEYGFVVRYPEGEEAITGFIWEPWHLRYVGRELATEMHTQGVATLEEFFGLPAAPGYL